MSHTRSRDAFAVAILVCALAVPGSRLAANGGVSKQDADRLEEKIVRVILRGTQRGGPTPQRTPVSETEVNAYLRLHGSGRLPTGVTNPTLRILNGNRLQGRAIVDLDMIRRGRGTTSWLDPRNYVGGRVPVIAIGVLHTARGVGRFHLERAEVAGVPVPTRLMRELVTYYSRSAEYPHGIPLDEPFTLTHRIHQVEFAEGRAVIVQQ
jgi:hypothetical protein